SLSRRRPIPSLFPYTTLFRSTGDDKEHVLRVELDKFLVRVLASTLRRGGGDRALQNLQQCLLYALTGDVACDGRVLGLTADLVLLVDVDNAALRRLDVEVCALQQLQQDVLDILAHVSGLGQRGRVRDGEGDVQHACEGLRQVGLTGAGGPQHED